MTDRLSADDFELSMRISPRPTNAEAAAEPTRSLLVHRLANTDKAVGRLSLRRNRRSMFCEPCHRWERLRSEDFSQEWTCPECGRAYEMEFAVYAEVDPDDDGN